MRLPLVLVLSILVAGCICNQGGSGSKPGKDFTKPTTTLSDGKKGPVKGSQTMKVANPKNPERDECKNGCDTQCGQQIQQCNKNCENKYENICGDASKLLAACNIACQYIPVPPGPGPNPRADCFNKCLDEFQKQCNNQLLKDCQGKCPSNYQSCQKTCYMGC